MISICKLFIPFFCRRSEGTHQHGSSIPPKYGVNKVHGHVDGYHDRVTGGFMLFLYYYVPSAHNRDGCKCSVCLKMTCLDTTKIGI